MSQPNTLTMQVFDKKYCINCPDDGRISLEGAARYLDGRTRRIRFSGKVIDVGQVAVMAAPNITHGLLHHEEYLDQESSSTHEHARELLDRVDRILASPTDIGEA